MVEGAGLENRYIRKGIAGSNPALSATISLLQLTQLPASTGWPSLTRRQSGLGAPVVGEDDGEGAGFYGDGAAGPPCHVNDYGQTQPRPPLLRMRASLSSNSALMSSTVSRSPSLIPDRYGARTCRGHRARLTAPPRWGLYSWGMAMGHHGVLGSLTLVPQSA